jgi:hypothetical protein
MPTLRDAPCVSLSVAFTALLTLSTLVHTMTMTATKFEAIDALASWSENYSGYVTPFAVYLDLIGFSVEHYGEKIVFSDPDVDPSSVLGYKELCLLADALQVFKDNGYDAVYSYISSIIND